LEQRLARFEGNDEVLVMTARVSESRTPYLRELVYTAWALQELDDRYAAFLERFRPVYKAASSSDFLDPELAFRVRTLLIHEYRKILLRDPFLPDALLPERWNGNAAYQLCCNIYSLLAGPAETFVTGNMESANGPLPPADPAYFERFGQLLRADMP
jgi:phenylacetic acid degradation operon negative regulatory protein